MDDFARLVQQGMLPSGLQVFRQGGVNSSRLLEGINSSDEMRQMSALMQLCDELNMASSLLYSSITGAAFVPALVRCLHKQHNAELMLLAARALTYMLDPIPDTERVLLSSSEHVKALLQHLQSMQDVELAEQCLTCVDKLCQSYGGAVCVFRAGGVEALLAFVDFFTLAAQRKVWASVARLCKAVDTHTFALVRDCVPVMCAGASSGDAAVRGKAMQALLRVLVGVQDDCARVDAVFVGLVTSLLQCVTRVDVGDRAFAVALQLLCTAAVHGKDSAREMISGGIVDALRTLLEHAVATSLSHTATAATTTTTSSDAQQSQQRLSAEQLRQLCTIFAALLVPYDDGVVRDVDELIALERCSGSGGVAAATTTAHTRHAARHAHATQRRHRRGGHAEQQRHDDNDDGDNDEQGQHHHAARIDTVHDHNDTNDDGGNDDDDDDDDDDDYEDVNEDDEENNNNNDDDDNDDENDDDDDDDDDDDGANNDGDDEGAVALLPHRSRAATAALRERVAHEVPLRVKPQYAACHIGRHTCDGCRRACLPGDWYRCNDCVDVDFCATCLLACHRQHNSNSNSSNGSSGNSNGGSGVDHGNVQPHTWTDMHAVSSVHMQTSASASAEVRAARMQLYATSSTALATVLRVTPVLLQLSHDADSADTRRACLSFLVRAVALATRLSTASSSSSSAATQQLQQLLSPHTRALRPTAVSATLAAVLYDEAAPLSLHAYAMALMRLLLVQQPGSTRSSSSNSSSSAYALAFVREGVRHALVQLQQRYHGNSSVTSSATAAADVTVRDVRAWRVLLANEAAALLSLLPPPSSDDPRLRRLHKLVSLLTAGQLHAAAALLHRVCVDGVTAFELASVDVAHALTQSLLLHGCRDAATLGRFVRVLCEGDEVAATAAAASPHTTRQAQHRASIAGGGNDGSGSATRRAGEDNGVGERDDDNDESALRCLVRHLQNMLLLPISQQQQQQQQLLLCEGGGVGAVYGNATQHSEEDKEMLLFGMPRRLTFYLTPHGQHNSSSSSGQQQQQQRGSTLAIGVESLASVHTIATFISHRVLVQQRPAAAAAATTASSGSGGGVSGHVANALARARRRLQQQLHSSSGAHGENDDDDDDDNGSGGSAAARQRRASARSDDGNDDDDDEEEGGNNNGDDEDDNDAHDVANASTARGDGGGSSGNSNMGSGGGSVYVRYDKYVLPPSMTMMQVMQLHLRLRHGCTPEQPLQSRRAATASSSSLSRSSPPRHASSASATSSPVLRPHDTRSASAAAAATASGSNATAAAAPSSSSSSLRRAQGLQEPIPLYYSEQPYDANVYVPLSLYAHLPVGRGDDEVAVRVVLPSTHGSEPPVLRRVRAWLSYRFACSHGLLSPQQRNVLQLLGALHECMRHWPELMRASSCRDNDNGSAAAAVAVYWPPATTPVPASAFVNVKLDNKAVQCGCDVLLAGQHARTWAVALALDCPFLFRPATRALFFDVAFCSTARALVKIQHARSAWSGGGAAHDSAGSSSDGGGGGGGAAATAAAMAAAVARHHRLPRTKWRVQRERVLEGAFGVFDVAGDAAAAYEAEMLCGGGTGGDGMGACDNKTSRRAAARMALYNGCSSAAAAADALWEFDFVNEPGSGLGPTREFYSLVAQALQQRTLRLWRGNEEAATALYYSPSHGLYPRPIATATTAAAVTTAMALPQHEAEEHARKTTMSPPSASVVQREATRVYMHFYLIGQLLARTLLDGHVATLPLSPVLLRMLRGDECSVHDLRQLSPALCDVLLAMLHAHATGATLLQLPTHASSSSSSSSSAHNKDTSAAAFAVEALSLDFTLPGDEALSLLPASTALPRGGVDVPVTRANMLDYCDRVVAVLLHEGVACAVRALRRGFDTLMPLCALSMLTVDELHERIHGSTRAVTRAELEQHCLADHGYSLGCRHMRWLFDILVSFTAEEQATFFRFLTGAAALPVGGLASLQPKMTVVRKTSTDAAVKEGEQLPSAMTCQNYLKLPAYESKAVMEQKLRLAMREGANAFMLT